ncbi:hypothetical protein B4114_2946 [Geobacillus stearothermophilus]|uniref:Uncharacterized protein n=1 Tax=Geobacillus stearothermophilus TaxID=1422 RepID=A0A150N221_GEOSE|nr:hypothetical protein B4114_2946 [Geobacillus stearothermophilus]
MKEGKAIKKTAGSLRSKKSGRFLYVNYPPPTLRLEAGASSDLCVFAER